MIKRLLQSYCDFTGSKSGEGSLKINIEKNFVINLLLLCLPLYFITLNGYTYGKYDHETYLPTILHLYDSSYYPDDFLFDDMSMSNYSFFIPVMVALLKILPCSLEALCLVGFLLCLYVIFWTIYHISLNLFGSRSPAVFAVFFLLLRYNGYNLPFIDN